MPLPTTLDPAHSGTNVILSSGNLGCRPVALQNSSRATNGWTMSGTRTVQWTYKYTAVDPICAPAVGIAINGDPYDGNGLNGYAPTCSQGGFAYSDNDVGGGGWFHLGVVHSLGPITHPIGGGQIINGVIACVIDPVGLTLAVFRVPWNGSGYNAAESVYTITGLTPGLKIYPTIGQGNANDPSSPTNQAWLANFGASPFAAVLGDISFDTAIGVITNSPAQMLMMNP